MENMEYDLYSSSHFLVLKIFIRYQTTKTLPDAQQTQKTCLHFILLAKFAIKKVMESISGSVAMLSSSGCTTCILNRYNFCHQVVLLYKTWIFGQQVAPLVLVANFVTRWCHWHWLPGDITCFAILIMITLLATSVGIALSSSSARVTSIKASEMLVAPRISECFGLL